MKIITVPNEILRKKSQPVEAFTPEVLTLIDNLQKTLSPTQGGLGLSAIQCGTPLRIFVAWVGNLYQAEPFINPEIIEKSEDASLYYESCLSIPDTAVKVKRSFIIKLRYTTGPLGIKEVKEFYGLQARIIQHEMDHLDGTLITDLANYEIEDKN